MKSVTLALFALLLAASALAAPPEYHLELEANPAAPFPFLGKFGSVDIHVYPEGVRADTIWLDGFSRTGSPVVTVMNPFGRMYTEVALREVSSILTKLSGSFPYRNAAGVRHPPVSGKVRDIDAARHRISYGPEAWIDLWTTRAIPENPQLRSIVDQFVSGISPASAAVARSIPGVPIYVELNFRSYKKLPLLRLKKLTFADGDADDALNVGALYFKAPLLDALWK